MRILSFIILCTGLFFKNPQTDSPHGSGFKISCKTCHSSKGWQLDKEVYSFDHNTTRLSLTGQHSIVSCRQCHPTLKFSEAKSNCFDCHTDVHQVTAGLDCSRCHTPSSWMVYNINEIHRLSRFPLDGAHRTADCIQCHKSENNTRFDVSGVKCIDCHLANYLAASNPNHIQSGFSEECATCHPVNSFQWTGAGFNHNFFPLVLGHSILRCSDCHKTPAYSDAKPDCYFCHQADFNKTNNPNHASMAFSTTCTLCHTLNQGWKPASFTQHDNQYFPIYSGRHNGKWNTCTDCHADPSNYSLFTCVTCHNKADMDDAHGGRSGYSYDSAACYYCHPRGSN
ncbi:MAG: hypothetical protein EPN88_08455 [Bacteroidetes bacterium]|nr:MAG: hypothetical protein EPN88_08455 [Bacteroidota bacterium]